MKAFDLDKRLACVPPLVLKFVAADTKHL